MQDTRPLLLDSDFPPLIRALQESGFSGGVHVELSRHSHAGPAVARQAYRFLKPLMDAAVRGKLR